MKSLLTITRGNDAGKTFELIEEVVTIGSARGNSIMLQDADISPQHCRITLINDHYDISDLDSRFGTFVNGHAIKSDWVLRHGSRIELGSHVTLEFTLPENKLTMESSALLPRSLLKESGAKQPCLVLVKNGRIKDAFLLRSTRISMGRSTNDNDIVIQETDVSRRHAQLIVKDNRYYIQDLKSSNGTYLNNIIVNGPVRLNRGDVIRLASNANLHYVYLTDLPPEWDPTETSKRPTSELPQFDSIRLALPSDRKTATTMTGPLTPKLTEGELEDHILISYAREDWEDIVASITMNLQDSKLKVWTDQHLRVGTADWLAAVEQAQAECWMLIVVISPQSISAQSVVDQYRYFFNRDKPVVLVEYKPINRLPMNLMRAPRIQYDKGNPGMMFRRLLYEVMVLKPKTTP